MTTRHRSNALSSKLSRKFEVRALQKALPIQQLIDLANCIPTELPDLLRLVPRFIERTGVEPNKDLSGFDMFVRAEMDRAAALIRKAGVPAFPSEGCNWEPRHHDIYTFLFFVRETFERFAEQKWKTRAVYRWVRPHGRQIEAPEYFHFIKRPSISDVIERVVMLPKDTLPEGVPIPDEVEIWPPTGPEPSYLSDIFRNGPDYSEFLEFLRPLNGIDTTKIRRCRSRTCNKFFWANDVRQTACSKRCGTRERVRTHRAQPEGDSQNVAPANGAPSKQRRGNSAISETTAD